MRGQSKSSEQMRRGRTIVAERERAESESERMQARRQAHRKKKRSMLVGVLFLVVIGLSAYLGFRELENRREETLEQAKAEKLEVTVPVIDEDQRGQISERVRAYIAELEREFARKGYTVERVTLPTGMIRAIYVDLEGGDVFLKMNIDRSVEVSVEDAEKMLKYLDEHDLHPAEYVDVRLEGKAYYK